MAVRTRTRTAPTVTATVADLFREEYEPMLRLATLMVGSEAVAEELVQDAFVKVHRAWDRIERSPGGYLRTTVLNACRSHHRRRMLEDAVRLAPSRDVDRIPEPDGILPHLDDLTYKRRAAVVLRYYEDLPDDEIAAILGVRPATVRSLVHRALEQLREVLDV